MQSYEKSGQFLENKNLVVFVTSTILHLKTLKINPLNQSNFVYSIYVIQMTVEVIVGKKIQQSKKILFVFSVEIKLKKLFQRENSIQNSI